MITCSCHVDFHLVGGQCPGLIGADEVNAAESFDGWQTFDDRVLACHPHNAEGQCHGHDDRQSLGNGCDSPEAKK